MCLFLFKLKKRLCNHRDKMQFYIYVSNMLHTQRWEQIVGLDHNLSVNSSPHTHFVVFFFFVSIFVQIQKHKYKQDIQRDHFVKGGNKQTSLTWGACKKLFHSLSHEGNSWGRFLRMWDNKWRKEETDHLQLVVKLQNKSLNRKVDFPLCEIHHTAENMWTRLFRAQGKKTGFKSCFSNLSFLC